MSEAILPAPPPAAPLVTLPDPGPVPDPVALLPKSSRKKWILILSAVALVGAAIVYQRGKKKHEAAIRNAADRARADAEREFIERGRKPAGKPAPQLSRTPDLRNVGKLRTPFTRASL